jgi:hypothetical protein
MRQLCLKNNFDTLTRFANLVRIIFIENTKAYLDRSISPTKVSHKCLILSPQGVPGSLFYLGITS